MDDRTHPGEVRRTRQIVLVANRPRQNRLHRRTRCRQSVGEPASPRRASRKPWPSPRAGTRNRAIVQVPDAPAKFEKPPEGQGAELDDQLIGDRSGGRLHGGDERRPDRPPHRGCSTCQGPDSGPNDPSGQLRPRPHDRHRVLNHGHDGCRVLLRQNWPQFSETDRDRPFSRAASRRPRHPGAFASPAGRSRVARPPARR